MFFNKAKTVETPNLIIGKQYHLDRRKQTIGEFVSSSEELNEVNFKRIKGDDFLDENGIITFYYNIGPWYLINKK